MAAKIVPVRPDHIPALAKICFEAFGALQDRHGVERDFDSVETSEMVVGMFGSRPDVAGFAAEENGELLGSNFIMFADPVASVGPITVAPGTQARGVGKALMLAVMEEARKRGVAQVRLQQEAINTASLSLYTKLGFDWRDGCALVKIGGMAAVPPAAGATIRAATGDDLEAIDRISSRQFHATRRGECGVMLKMGFPTAVLVRGGEVRGYHFPGFLGHGFAETAADLAALIAHSARHAPPPFQKVLVPLSQNELHRTLLGHGARTVKLFNYMTVGPFTPPGGAWVPSIGC